MTVMTDDRLLCASSYIIFHRSRRRRRLELFLYPSPLSSHATVLPMYVRIDK